VFVTHVTWRHMLAAKLRYEWLEVLGWLVASAAVLAFGWVVLCPV